MDFLLTWQFRNGHTYTKDFATSDARDTFMNSVGLIAHSDIVKVIASYPETSIKSVVLKDVIITKQLAEADTMAASRDMPTYTINSNTVPKSHIDHMAMEYSNDIPAFTTATMPMDTTNNIPSLRVV
jgi:hypothetical protein